jgi:hypothetical protein
MKKGGGLRRWTRLWIGGLWSGSLRGTPHPGDELKKRTKEPEEEEKEEQPIDEIGHKKRGAEAPPALTNQLNYFLPFFCCAAAAAGFV